MNIFDPSLNRKLWNLLIAWIWAIMLCVSVFPDQIGEFEGSNLPVIRDFKITSVTETADGATVIYAEGVKARSCALRDVDWSIIKEGLDTAVGFDNREIQKVNRPGPVSFGPWVVYAPKSEVLANGKAVIVHRCHYAFRTRTQIFKGVELP